MSYDYFEATFNAAESYMLDKYDFGCNNRMGSNFEPMFRELTSAEPVTGGQSGSYYDRYAEAVRAYMDSDIAYDDGFAEYAYTEHDVLIDDPEEDYAHLDMLARKYALKCQYEELESLYDSIRTGTHPCYQNAARLF